MFFHWDQTLDVSTAYGTCMFCFNKALATLFTNAQMTTRHNNRILLGIKANQTLFVFIFFHINMLLTFYSFVLLCHSVDCFDFKWKYIN